MAANQSVRHQKRSRAKDGLENVVLSGDERAKRRRTSDGDGTQNPGTSLNTLSGEDMAKGAEKQKGSVAWSFSRPVGGRYSNADPIMTTNEE